MSSCPCGLTGANCTELARPLTDISQAMTEFCFEEGFRKCLLQKNSAECQCECGFEGELCDEEIIPLISNMILAMITSALIISVVISFIYRRSLNGTNLTSLPKSAFYETSSERISPQFLFFYRVMMVLLCIAVWIQTSTTTDYRILRTFTFWNWTLFGFVFLLGSLISYRGLNPNPNAIKDDEKSGWLETAFQVLLSLELSASIGIALVVWLILLPATKETGDEEFVVNPNSFFVHAINVALLMIEFGMDGLKFERSHWIYAILWVSLYDFYHTWYMVGQHIGDDPHCPIYGFLDMSQHLFMLFQFGLLFVFGFFFYLGTLISSLKEKYLF